jgi:hypothetical protein
MLPFTADIITALLPSLSSADDKLRYIWMSFQLHGFVYRPLTRVGFLKYILHSESALAANANLVKLVKDTEPHRLESPSAIALQPALLTTMAERSGFTLFAL